MSRKVCRNGPGDCPGGPAAVPADTRREKVMKKTRTVAAAAILAAALCLSGCGGSNNMSSSGSYYEPAMNSAAKEAGYAAAESAAGSYDYDAMEMEEARESSEDASYTADSGTGSSALRAQDGQKIVYTASLSIQSLEYDQSAASIRRKIREAGGFSEAESEYDKDYNWYRYNASSSNTRSLSITARIPSDKFEAFLNSLDGDGKIMSKSVNAQNISQVYANKETYKKALEKEQERLLAMMDKAETIEDMIAVESRLSEVERQLNSYKTDLSQMDKDVEFSTVYIDLQEVKRYTETVEKTTFREKLGFAFEDAISSFRDFCEGVILFVVRNFPFLIIFAIIAALIIRWLAKRRAQKIALLTNPEYAKVMTAKVQAKADADARKFAAKEERRRSRGGLFGKKKADTGAGPEAPIAETPVAETPVTETPVAETPVAETPVRPEDRTDAPKE